MLKLRQLPGNRGSYIAKTEKKTRMFTYQVTGTDAEMQAYVDAKEAEGHSVVIDAEFGPLYFTSINLGREGVLEVNKDGKIFGYNPAINAAKEKVGVLSENRIDQLIEAALDAGSYAKPLVAESVDLDKK